MKKYIGKTIFALAITAILFSCKKDTSKDYAASIAGKTWWGTRNYPGLPEEYYSVQFNADNSLIWSEVTGDYAGNWVLEEKALTLTFAINTFKIKADISENDSLLNITENTTDINVISGKLISNPTLPLDNTIWKGSLAYGSPNISFQLQLNFMPSSKVASKVGTDQAITYPYTRTSGAVIRFTSYVGSFFGIITSGAEIKGMFISSMPSHIQDKWQTVKQ